MCHKSWWTQNAIGYYRLWVITVWVISGLTVPNIMHQLAKLAEEKYFIALDMFSAYFQVGIKEEDRNKAAFTTSNWMMPLLWITGKRFENHRRVEE